MAAISAPQSSQWEDNVYIVWSTRGFVIVGIAYLLRSIYQLLRILRLFRGSRVAQPSGRQASEIDLEALTSVAGDEIAMEEVVNDSSPFHSSNTGIFQIEAESLAAVADAANITIDPNNSYRLTLPHISLPSVPRDHCIRPHVAHVHHEQDITDSVDITSSVPLDTSEDDEAGDEEAVGLNEDEMTVDVGNEPRYKSLSLDVAANGTNSDGGDE
ncbi:hypothetical protein ACLMJK_009572 [Lecanora helva]